MAGTRKLTVEVLGDVKGLSGSFKEASDGADGLGQKFEDFGKKAAVAFSVITGGALLLAKNSFNAAMDSQKVFKQTEGLIAATGSAAGVTAKDVGKLADKLSFATGQDDELIMSSLNLLLTFKNLKNSAGEGNKIFDRTGDVMLDVANVFGSADSAARILGKAINDPINNLDALKRVSITLTDSEKDQIKTWQESGQTLEAQKFILEKLEGTYGGTAEASRSMTDVMKVSVENLNESVGTYLIPAFEGFAETIVTKVVPAVQNFIDKQMPGVISFFEKMVEKIQPVIDAIADWLLPNLKKLIDWMRDNEPAVAAFFGTIAGAAVIGMILAVGGAIAGLFSPIILIIGGIALLAGGFAYAYDHFATFRTVVDGVVKWVRDTAIPAIVTAFKWLFDRAKEIFDGLKQWFEGWVEIFRGVINVFLGILKGDWSRAWDGLKSIVSGVFDSIVGMARTFLVPILAAFGVIWAGIKAGMSHVFDGLAGVFKSALNTALNGVERGLNWAIDLLNKMLSGVDVALGPSINFGEIPHISIPSLSMGGVVMLPTIATLAENGPEAIIPLSMITGSTNNSSEVQIAVNGGDPYATVAALRKYYRTNGGIPIRVVQP